MPRVSPLIRLDAQETARRKADLFNIAVIGALKAMSGLTDTQIAEMSHIPASTISNRMRCPETLRTKDSQKIEQVCGAAILDKLDGDKKAYAEICEMIADIKRRSICM